MIGQDHHHRLVVNLEEDHHPLEDLDWDRMAGKQEVGNDPGEDHHRRRGLRPLGVASEADKVLAHHSPDTLPDRPGRHGHSSALLRLPARIYVTAARRAPDDLDRSSCRHCPGHTCELLRNYFHVVIQGVSRIAPLYFIVRILVQLHAGQLELAQLRLAVVCDLRSDFEFAFLRPSAP